MRMLKTRLYRHRADVCTFKLVVLPLLVQMFFSFSEILSSIEGFSVGVKMVLERENLAL